MPLRREKFNLNQFGGALGGPIQKDKTFFFIDYQARQQRKGVAFNGFVPTAAMRTGDFSADLFGVPLPAGTQVLFNPYSIVGPNGRDPFMCDGTGNPEPVAANGTQAPGAPCNKIPAGLINPITQQIMLSSRFYPLPTPGIAPGSGFNFSNVPVRKLNEGEFDVRLDHTFSSKDTVFARFSYDQATNFVPGGSPGFAEPSPFASSQDITNHGRNVALSETHIFSDRTHQSDSAAALTAFSTTSCRLGTVPANRRKLGIPGANLDDSCSGFPGGAPAGLVPVDHRLRQLRPDRDLRGRTLLGAGGPRLRSLPGRNQRLLHLRLA